MLAAALLLLFGLVGAELAGDDPGHVRAVAFHVFERLVPASEVAMDQRRRQLEVLVLREVRMRAVDARVDDGPDDPGAAGGERVVRGVGFDRC